MREVTKKRGRPKGSLKADIGKEIKSILGKAADTDEMREVFRKMGVPESSTWAKAIGCAIVQKASAGDKSAIDLVRALLEEKSQNADLKNTVVIISGEDKIEK